MDLVDSLLTLGAMPIKLASVVMSDASATSSSNKRIDEGEGGGSSCVVSSPILAGRSVRGDASRSTSLPFAFLLVELKLSVWYVYKYGAFLEQ